MLPQLQKMNWAHYVDVDDLNWGPIAIVQKFQALPIAYDRVPMGTSINLKKGKIFKSWERIKKMNWVIPQKLVAKLYAISPFPTS